MRRIGRAIKLTPLVNITQNKTFWLGQPGRFFWTGSSTLARLHQPKIAFNLITTALTLTQEAIPTGLAVYNHQKVILTTAILDPREILKRTLSLVKDITSVEFAYRLLQLSNLGKLRRDITQLRRATSEPAQQLLNILNFEYQAIEKTAKNHPATLALSSVAEQAPPPATIVLISQLNHDVEALLVTTEKLSRREFTTIPIEIN
jgi:hypothetical protein